MVQYCCFLPAKPDFTITKTGESSNRYNITQSKVGFKYMRLIVSIWKVFIAFGHTHKGRIQCNIEYEDYVLNEVILCANEKKPTPFLMSLGCRMGANHAIHIGLRHPRMSILIRHRITCLICRKANNTGEKCYQFISKALLFL
ncbi:MAG: hypothetical protein AUK44_03300 [Porphyromonadaceae bacterium CG2_30_38_12]|nr:MAG: hypothetical protein AUK44_03300 [Porphyromonadaceae bacterium CG2_30_38_12]